MNDKTVLSDKEIMAVWHANGASDTVGWIYSYAQAIERAVLERIQPAASEAEPLVRYCPGCGSIGPIEGKYRDCCPDGSDARIIPQALAEKCRDTFKLAVKSLLTDAAANDASEAGAVPVAWRYWDERHKSWAATGSLEVAESFMSEIGRKPIALYAAPPSAPAAEPVAYCQPDDPVNSSAFSWPGLGRKKAHTVPLFRAAPAAENTTHEKTTEPRTAIRSISGEGMPPVQEMGKPAQLPESHGAALPEALREFRDLVEHHATPEERLRGAKMEALYATLSDMGIRLPEDSIRRLLAAVDSAAESAELTPSEAVYGFAAWLTCMGESVVTHDAAKIAELVAAFVDSQKWAQPREDYTSRLRPYPTAATASAEPMVPLIIEYDPGYPEIVAFGTQMQMDRLKKWLDKFFAMRRIQQAGALPELPAPITKSHKQQGNGAYLVFDAYNVDQMMAYAREALASAQGANDE